VGLVWPPKVKILYLSKIKNKNMALIGVIFGFGIGVLAVVGYELLMKLLRKNKLKSKKSKKK
jgi:hypothetical protein